MKSLPTKRFLDAVVEVPGSKSVTHRALIAAALATGESRIDNALRCEDTSYTMEGLRTLGIEIQTRSARTMVSGTGGCFAPPDEKKTIFLGNSGTSLRLLLSVAALAPGEHVLTGLPRLCERPIADLVTALTAAGAVLQYAEKAGYPPVLVHGGRLRGGKVVISGKHSSQFVSSLLLAGVCAEEDLEVEIADSLVSKPYVDVTLDVMQRFGVDVTRDDYRWFKVPSGQQVVPRHFKVEGDLSSASYFWAAAAVAGGKVCTVNVRPRHTQQGDRRILAVLREMGCRVEMDEESVTVEGNTLRAIDVDMGAMPDMVPTLSAVALFAEGKTQIRNVAHLRSKESDRLHAIAGEWRKLGARIDELENGLVIYGGTRLAGAVLDPHDDHRLAMAGAVIGLRVGNIGLRNADCVRKSFPDFWRLWDRL